MTVPLIKNSFSLKLLASLFFFGMMYSCKKNDQLPSNTLEQIEEAEAKKKDPKSDGESATVVYEWFKLMARVQRLASPQPAPPFNYRNYGFIGVGLYEAVQPGIKTAKSLSEVLYQMPAMPQADKHKDYLWTASANAALASLFKQFLPVLSAANIFSIDSMEAAQNSKFSLTTPADVVARSQAFGRSVATAIYTWAATDNFTLSSVGYTVPVCPSCWVSTANPPGPPVGAFLKDSRPFLESSLTALAPPIPAYYAYSESPSSGFYQAVKEVHDIGLTLTAEQKAIANWWADAGGPGVGLPTPYHIISIVTGVLESQNANLWKAAEIYAKTGIGTKDGPIITFRSKFHYNLLRPITYIRRHINAGWSSYLGSPAYPDYTSGLVSNYAPVIQVLIKEFGDIPYTDDCYSWRGSAPRVFTSLNQLLKEASDSRVYAGIHYRFTQDISVLMGKVLGNQIASLHKIGPNH